MFLKPPLMLVLALMLALLLVGLLLVFRRRGRVRPAHARRGAWGWALYGLRLAGFGLLSLLLTGYALLLYEDLQAVSDETRPMPSAVEAPPDLPFAVEEVRFASLSDGTRLAGWYVAPRNGVVVILLHGYSGNRLGMLWHARALVKAGYGALLYDERASGESGGARRSFGWEDAPDVGGAVAFIQSRAGADARVGIAGCSMGGQIALQGAAGYPAIGAVWADGPAVLRAADNPPPQNALRALFLVSNYTLDWLYILKEGIAPPAPLIEQVGRIAPRPLMLVGGGSSLGRVGAEDEQLSRYAAFAGPNARVWVIEEGVHCDGPQKVPEEYERRLVDFFDEAFRP